MGVDPDTLADSLPGRPLSPETVEDIFAELDWSVAPVVEETDDGTAFVRSVYAYDDETRRAMSLRFVGGEWIGDVEAEDVSHSEWLNVTQQAADAAGLEGGVDAVGFDDGSVREFE